MTIDLFSAFIIGLLGSGHCLGMCGGITTMLTSALPQPTHIKNNLLASKNNKSLLFVFFYHIGRISSYTLIGALVGLTGSYAAKNLGMPVTALRIISAIFLIFLGLYLAQWLMVLSKVEQLGKILWRFISPLSKKLIPVNNAKQALALGMLWGWLPCGLVYSTLTWSLASNSLFYGASIMLVFGLGTLPALLSVSLGFFSLKNLLSNAYFRKTMAILVITYGVYSLVIATKPLFLYY